MIALDLNLEGALDRLGSIKGGSQCVLTPSGPWAANHFAIRERQFDLVSKKQGNVNEELRASVAALMEEPVFQSIATSLPLVEGRSKDLTVPFYELVLNALDVSRVSDSEVPLCALMGEEGVLFGVSNNNTSQFDPHAYVAEKKGWFLRDGLTSEEGAIQRGKGFQCYSNDNRICVFFDHPDAERLFTGVFVPYSLKSYDLRSQEIRALEKTAIARYLELGALVNFQFDEEWHRPPAWPDLSEESREGLERKLAELRPELREEFQRVRKVLELSFHPLFNHYLQPEKHLL